MRSNYMIGLLVMLVISATGVSTWAEALTDDSSALRSEVAELRVRLAELEAHQNDAWLSQRRAEEFKGMVREVLQDADMRASLLESHMTAGHNGSGFFLSSEDGSFLLNLRGYVQMRHVNNSVDDGAGIDGTERGFEFPRAKIIASGHIADPRLGYLVSLSVNPDTNNVSADELSISYEWMDGVTISGGESKAPFMREEMIEPTHQLAVDRSYVNETFTAGIVQGIGVTWDASDDMLVRLSLNDGAGSGEDATAGFSGDSSDIAITARVDLKLAGSWDQWSDYSAWSGEGQALFVGVAVHHEVGETGDANDNDNATGWTVDAALENNGWNLSAAVTGVNSDFETTADADPYGLVAQAGYNCSNSGMEPYVRWEQVDFDGAADDVEILTVGVNRYFNNHAAKLSVDVVWTSDAIPVAAEDIGIRATGANNDDQVVIRSQLQLMF